MKNIFHSALLAMAVLVSVNFSVNAQDLIPDQNAKGKWGYVNSDGLKVINYNYTHASAFRDGRALVQKGGKWGYIDEHGKEVIKIKFTAINYAVHDKIIKISCYVIFFINFDNLR